MRTSLGSLLIVCLSSIVLAACADENGNTAVSTPTGGSTQAAPGTSGGSSPGTVPSPDGSSVRPDDFHATVALATQADGLQIGDFAPGSGAAVQAHQSVTVQYTGWLPDGTVFDSSRKAGRTPAKFSLDGVIKGWGEGLVGMKVGGKRRLVIPGPLAYGANPPPGSGIPPNGTLTFDIELLSIG